MVEPGFQSSLSKANYDKAINLADVCVLKNAPGNWYWSIFLSGFQRGLPDAERLYCRHN
jgi:hypothetical protein